ncbi:MAG: immunoglobulin-like domain-containing protein [Acutalibacteraceae bacterium]
MKRLFALISVFVMLAAFSACKSAEFDIKSEYDNDIEESADILMTIKNGQIDDNGLTVRIDNRTENEISYGMEYVLEQKKEDGWYSYSGEQYVNEIAALVQPRAFGELNVFWGKPLDAGTYRVVKDIWETVDGESVKHTLAVEFSV